MTEVDKAIATLPLPAKVRLLTGAALFSLHPEPEIGLAALVLSDGPTGVRGTEFTGGRIACLLPNATLLAQHWDPATAAEVGALLADEAAAQGVHVVLGPTINLHRSPLGGRLFEAFSEDPLLTGALAVAYVKGLQDKGVAATPKHFLANESETERTSVSSVVDERTLREVYLLPFEMAVHDAGPWAVMASYNRINGVTATEHEQLIEGLLKGEWAYDGLVMSDWFATTSTAASANGGLDLVMPGPDGPWGGELVAAVEAGEVSESTVDEHLRRLLRLADRVGAFGPPQVPDGLPAPDSPQRREQLRRMAARGMTVLVNRDSTLPLAGQGKVVVIGRHAIETIGQGGGSARVRPPHIVGIGDALREALGATVVDGVEVRAEPLPAAPGVLRDPVTGGFGMRVTARDGSGVVLESRLIDTSEVSAGDGGWLDGAATIELAAEIVSPHPMEIGLRGTGEWTFEAGDRQETVRLEEPKALGGSVLHPPSWTIDGRLEPGARVRAVTAAQPGMRTLGLIARLSPRPDTDGISEATEAARGADLAVVVVGLTQEQETEGADKSTLALPGAQDALVSAVAAAARRTVVVVNAATPVLMPWLDEVGAVLWAGLPGQEAGDAVAAALTGEIEPAGRLVTTFPERDGEGPAWSTTPVEGELAYTEGTAVGYRGWTTEPLFWFGHGLGYTDWSYGDARRVEDDGVVRSVRVEVTNVGARTGREVVQVYLRPEGEPVRLIGWAGVDLDPGARAEVEVSCDPRVQRVWDNGSWRPLTGAVLIARGLGDVRVTA
ncbi:glycoside hydrolase family 3 C-terminal domain-containing protein [Amycolatopsis acidiphila]|uniref:Family 3 glycosyl hydrolase n=1 Tax=Amycolatopsis acidiphila TaxID=715473 RepID=A0A558A955_9PSEU|nr:glycoside hydrolase family 3 C-terminal domain-containing protein [Amycolatopsis acidiphila]TVT20788.1 family 3 glycosyl hydrolase [Amycolatopsis acidiphila]UIJ58337.1 glycoside hydrolase family 3 C-terminal domain-containing protein [Amycolatopsis acidiphila]GHG98909.1 glycosyl hydrolase [Amycolatopsis acidiphila]